MHSDLFIQLTIIDNNNFKDSSSYIFKDERISNYVII